MNQPEPPSNAGDDSSGTATPLCGVSEGAASDGAPSDVAPLGCAAADVTFGQFQRLIREMYYEKDVARGVDGTFMWLMEEVGELAAALRSGTHEERLGEFADVIAWLATIANVAGVDLTEAVQRKYGSGCPGCGQFVCSCDDAGKP